MKEIIAIMNEKGELFKKTHEVRAWETSCGKIWINKNDAEHREEQIQFENKEKDKFLKFSDFFRDVYLGPSAESLYEWLICNKQEILEILRDE